MNNNTKKHFFKTRHARNPWEAVGLYVHLSQFIHV